MELKDYTDEQLRSELKRRAILKAQKTREAHKREPYIYWEGVVEKVFTFAFSRRLSEIQFLVKPVENDGVVYQKFGKDGRQVILASDAGFNKKNIPQVGDRVKLRYRNKVKFDIFALLDSRIVEVVERGKAD